MSLRRVFFIATALTCCLAIAAAVALTAITRNMRSITKSMGDDMESLNVVRSLELALLSHGRTTDPVMRLALETEMLSWLQEARKYVGDLDEGQRLQVAADGLRTYLVQANNTEPPPFERPDSEFRVSSVPALAKAFAALESLAVINTAQARVAQQRALRLDTLSELLGSGTAISLVLGVLLVALWLQRSALKPLWRLRTAIERLGSGKRDSRAPETGPSELRELAAQFNQMASALERQRSEQLAFLGGVAHDLRNPLAALSASMMLFAPERPLPSEGRIRHVSELVKRQVGRLNRMVGDLLDAARIEAGELELRRETRDPNVMANEVWELFRDSSAQHEIEVVELPDAPVLSCDPLRVEQVLNNLVSNAIKYSPAGGRVIISVMRQEGQIGFSVSDEGVGIAPSDLPNVFQPFRRTASSRHSAPGVGLGLSVAKRIVEAHGGRITLQSALGRGTTASVWFPQADVQGVASAAEPDPDHADAQAAPRRASGQV